MSKLNENYESLTNFVLKEIISENIKKNTTDLDKMNDDFVFYIDFLNKTIYKNSKTYVKLNKNEFLSHDFYLSSEGKKYFNDFLNMIKEKYINICHDKENEKSIDDFKNIYNFPIYCQYELARALYEISVAEISKDKSKIDKIDKCFQKSIAHVNPIISQDFYLQYKNIMLAVKNSNNKTYSY